MEGTPTSASDIALPVEMVTLLHLRTKDGNPAVVRCEAVDELRVAEILKSLPGRRPARINGNGEAPPADDVVARAEATLDRMRVFDEYAPALIEAGTSFVDDAGNEVRPAFYFGERPNMLSVPGRLLRMEDRVRLVTAIMTLSGYGGGAADKAQFHDGERSGRDGGVGVVDAREGVGANAVGSGA